MPGFRYHIILIALFTTVCSKVAAQLDIGLELLVNNKQKLSVYRDEPLLISLVVTAPKASANEQWNREAMAGLSLLQNKLDSQDITQEEFTKEKQQIEGALKNVIPVVLGSDHLPVYLLVQIIFNNIQGDTLRVPVTLLNNGTIPAEFILDANAYYHLEWAIDRETIQFIPPGKYSVKVGLLEKYSNPVTVTVTTKPIPASVLNTVKMQTQLGQFALITGKADAALIHAKRILKLNASSIEGHLLSGEAYYTLQHFPKALKSFRSALRYYNKKYPELREPPEYLLGMIQQVKEDMEE